jgi:hypothetical protein
VRPWACRRAAVVGTRIGRRTTRGEILAADTPEPHLAERCSGGATTGHRPIGSRLDNSTLSIHTVPRSGPGPESKAYTPMAPMRRFATASIVTVIQRRQVPGGIPLPNFAEPGGPGTARPRKKSKLPLTYRILMDV